MGKRKLMTVDEVLRMDVDRALVILRGRNVLEVDKYDYSKHPESKKLRPSKAASHVPAWQTAQKAAGRKEVIPAPPKPKPARKSKASSRKTPPPKAAVPAETPAKVIAPEDTQPVTATAAPTEPPVPAPKKRVVTTTKDSILSKHKKEE